jgi:hypothetical protein
MHMNWNRLRIGMIFLACTLLAMLTVRAASANTQQNQGAFMAFGGSSTTASGLCIETAFSEVFTYACPTSSNNATPNFNQADQLFKVTDTYSSGFGTIEWIYDNAVQGCLDIYANNPSEGIVDLDSDCNGTEAQVWTYTNAGQIQSYYHPSYCLDVQDGSMSENTSIIIDACSSTAQSQVFLPLNFTLNIWTNYRVDGYGGCLDVYANDQVVQSGDTGDGYIDNANCNTTSAQWFTFEPNPNGIAQSGGAPGFNALMWSQYSDGVNACYPAAQANENCTPDACMVDCGSGTDDPPSGSAVSYGVVDGYSELFSGWEGGGTCLGSDTAFTSFGGGSYELILMVNPSCSSTPSASQGWNINLLGL